MSRKAKFWLNVFAPLFLGCLIYLFFKQDAVLSRFEDHVRIFRWLRDKLFIEFIPQSVLGIFFINYFCDFLWAYSLSWAWILATRNIIKGAVVAFIFCLLNEFVQLTPYICATFDWLDVLVETVAVTLASLIVYNPKKKIQNKKAPV